MATLVTLEDFHDFLGGEVVAEAGVRGEILTDVQATFLRECARESAPFVDAQTAKVERHKGTGSHVLFLDYPVAVLTSVVLGFDSTAPDLTLDVADKKVLIYEVGSRKLTRVDGGRFGGFGWPSYVHVTYNAAADLPTDARLAILRKAAAIYWRRGSEDTATEAASGFATSYSSEADLVWAEAVSAHRRIPL